MAPDAGTSRPEVKAMRAAIGSLLDMFRADIIEGLDELKRTADQLLDHVLAEQVPWARETMERLAPLVDESLAQGQAAAGAVLEQAKRRVPHVVAAQQHPWLLLGSVLLVGYLVSGGGPRAPASAPAQPRRPLRPTASDQL